MKNEECRRKSGSNRLAPMSADLIVFPPKKQAGVLTKMIAEQCSYWDPSAEAMTTPEARVLMAVVGRAISDLLGRHSPEKDQHKRAEDAFDFIFSARLTDYTNLLGLSSEWVKMVVGAWLTTLDCLSDDARAREAITALSD